MRESIHRLSSVIGFKGCIAVTKGLRKPRLQKNNLSSFFGIGMCDFSDSPIIIKKVQASIKITDGHKRRKIDLL
jgi:hypothetical protein